MTEPNLHELQNSCNKRKEGAREAYNREQMCQPSSARKESTRQKLGKKVRRISRQDSRRPVMLLTYYRQEDTARISVGWGTVE